MKLNLKGNTLGFICLTRWYFKGLAMDDAGAVRDMAYAKAKAMAEAVYQKTIDDALAAYGKVESRAQARAEAKKTKGK